MFNFELSLIGNGRIRKFVELCLGYAPKYIFTDCPSSSSGKYHPEDELGGNGCVIHTCRVVKLVCLLIDGMKDFDHRDEAIAAAIIHDLRKQGMEKSGRTVANHPDLAASLVYEVATLHPDVVDSDVVDALYNAVGYHYGQWGTGNWVCKDFYNSDIDRLSKVVHVADYLASRKEIGNRLKSK